MQVRNAFPVFHNLDGTPVRNGYVRIGIRGQNPLSFPQDAYWDEALTIPATNIRTVNGYAVWNGNPAQIYTAEPYSILVQDENLQAVYFRPEVSLPEKDVVLTEAGEAYALTNEDTTVNLTVAPNASGSRVTQDQNKVITRGLSDRTTAGKDGYLSLRPGQSLQLTRLEEGIQYSGAFAKIGDPEIISNTARAASWSPNGRYLSIAHNGSPYITTYDWASGSPVKLPDPTPLPTGDAPSINWSPDGRYLAFGYQTSPYLTIYDWLKGAPVKVEGPETPPPDLAYDVEWSPDGRYLAVAHIDTPYITIYDWGSGAPLKIADPATLPPDTGLGASWSSDGRYLAVGHFMSPYITIYDWSSGVPVKITNPGTLPTNVAIDVEWSPDGRYLAVAHVDTPYITIYDWTSGSPVKIADPATLPTGDAKTLAWSPDGRYLAVTHSTSPFITIYDWSSGSPVKIDDPSTLPTGVGSGVSWSPDGRYLAVGHATTPFNTIYSATTPVFDPWGVQHIDGPELRSADFV